MSADLCISDESAASISASRASARARREASSAVCSSALRSAAMSAMDTMIPVAAMAIRAQRRPSAKVVIMVWGG